ncbi:hypothetical protein [Flavobacterium sp. Root420]|uniref:hypothetical protein n=1 Tax=Flavobacterium sp. Root420 TaxID=1736533 RepID=UPI000ABB215D|nr:hypothetical protein [Flavobacterium sp. Root420]
MKSILKIMKATFLGGILFLAPLILLVVIFEKAYNIVQKITLPLVSHLPRIKFLGLAVQELTGIIIIIIIYFLAGILGRTAKAQKLVRKLEDGILSFIPGYSFIKKQMKT